MTNKIVVLAAGKGTRMLELSKDQPKHLIGVKNKPFLYYLLSNIKEAGYKEIILVVGYKKAKMEAFAEEYKNEFNLKLIDQFDIIGTDRYGTACPVECAEEAVDNEPFVVVNGDDLYSTDDLKKIKELDHDFCYTAGFRYVEPQHYGLLSVDENNFLERIVEKPIPDKDFDSSRPFEYLINIGLYKFTPEIFAAVKKIEKSPREEYELTDAVTLLAKDKKVKVLPINDYWLSFSRPSDIAKLERFLEKQLLS